MNPSSSASASEKIAPFAPYVQVSLSRNRWYVLMLLGIVSPIFLLLPAFRRSKNPPAS